MQPEDIVEKNAGDLGGVVSGMTGDTMDLLGELVDKDGNGIESAGSLGQRTDEIHSDSLPGSIRDGQRLEQAEWSLLAGLIPLAGLAGLDIEPGVLRHGGPEEPRVEMTISLLKAEVAGYGRVVGIMKERKTNIRLRRDANKQNIIAL